jgi:hypothetical protein
MAVAMIKTVSAFAKAVGKNPEVAELFGISVPALCNWKKGNRFPLWARARARDIATARRIRIDPALVKGGLWSDAAE